MPVCSECGQEPTIATAVECETCRRYQAAIEAERLSTSDRQARFLATNILLAINVAVFALMTLKGVPLVSPTAEQIQHWSGNFGPLTLGGQPWRMLTAVFVHIGIAHLVANLWALFILGRLAESLYGRATFIAVYLCAGVGGSLATLIWNPTATSAGASGAIFGIAGALILTLYIGKLPFPKRSVRAVLISLAVWAAFTLVYGVWKSGVDNAAHVGGLATGALLGLAIAHHNGQTREEQRWRWRVFASALVVLVFVGLLVWHQQGYIVQVDKARRLLLAQKYDDAVQLLQELAQRKPNKSNVHVLLGDVFSLQKRDGEAQHEYQRAVDLQPKSAMAWSKLASSYARQNKWTDAASAYIRAAQHTKDNRYLLYNAGLMYRRTDKYAEAVNLFRQAVARDPYFADAWYAMGVSLLTMRKAPEAISALEKASQLRTNDPDVHLWLGNARMAAGQEQQAQAEFAKAYRLLLLQQRAIQEIQKRRQVQ